MIMMSHDLCRQTSRFNVFIVNVMAYLLLQLEKIKWCSLVAVFQLFCVRDILSHAAKAKSLG